MRRRVTCSSAGAFLEIRTIATTLIAKDQASEPIQPAPAREIITSTATSSVARPAASLIPVRSVERRAPDAGSFSGRGNEEPGHQIAGDAEPSGERKQHEDGSHDRHVDAGPRRDAGGHTTEPARLPGRGATTPAFSWSGSALPRTHDGPRTRAELSGITPTHAATHQGGIRVPPNCPARTADVR